MQFINYFLKSSPPQSELQVQNSQLQREDWEDWVEINNNLSNSLRSPDTPSLSIPFSSQIISTTLTPAPLVLLDDYTPQSPPAESSPRTHHLPRPDQPDDVWTLSTVVPQVQPHEGGDNPSPANEEVWKEIASAMEEVVENELHFNIEMDCALRGEVRSGVLALAPGLAGSAAKAETQKETSQSKGKNANKKKKKKSPKTLQQTLSPPIRIPSATQQSSPACSPPQLDLISTSGPASLSNPPVPTAAVPVPGRPVEAKEVHEKAGLSEKSENMEGDIPGQAGMNPWHNPSDIHRFRQKLRVLSGEKV